MEGGNPKLKTRALVASNYEEEREMRSGKEGSETNGEWTKVGKQGWKSVKGRSYSRSDNPRVEEA